MTREKRIEALSWLIDQAEAVQSGIVGVEFGEDCDISICNSVPEVHIYGNGFYEMARAASQIVHNDPIVVNAATDAARAAKDTLAEYEGDGLRGVRLCAEGTAQLSALSGLAVVHHQHTAVHHAQRAAQIVVIAGNR